MICNQVAGLMKMFIVCLFQPLLDLKVICNLKQKYGPQKMMLLLKDQPLNNWNEAGTQKRGYEYTKIEYYPALKPNNTKFNIFCIL